MTTRTAAASADTPKRRANRKAIDWPPIIADHEANPTTPISQIAARNEVSAKALGEQIRKLAEAPPTDRANIVERLFRLVDLQVLDLQREMNEMRTENRRSGEKEVVLLGKIAANLEKLMALDGGGPASTRKARQRTKDIVDLRAKLIERIDHLKRQ